jgi:hypothetical protein
MEIKMKKIINNKLQIELDDDYQAPPLPYFNKWITALRSGEYTQGKGMLCRNGEYCCLGVLSKVQGRLFEHKIVERSNEPGTIFSDGEKSLRTYYELNEDNPCVDALDATGVFPIGCTVLLDFGGPNLTPVASLTVLNDNGVSFEDIAKVIEAVWKEDINSEAKLENLC